MLFQAGHVLLLLLLLLFVVFLLLLLFVLLFNTVVLLMVLLLLLLLWVLYVIIVAVALFGCDGCAVGMWLYMPILKHSSNNMRKPPLLFPNLNTK